MFGALYLFYLAYKVFKSSSRLDLSSDTIPEKSLGELFKQGFIMNVLNPKVSIFFLAFFPAFLLVDESDGVPQDSNDEEGFEIISWPVHSNVSHILCI
mgnify:CR=1 FL=1